jgi:predicted DNA-binding protein with PD1-like motif
MTFSKSSLKVITLFLLGPVALTANAAKYIAVDQNSCGERINSQKPFVLILKTGENLHEGIKKCARDAKLIGASIQGLGQFVNPVFAYYGPNANANIISLQGTYELISLNGNIAKSGGEYYNHIHAVLGDANLQATAGHIKEAIIGATAELTITPFSKSLERDVNPETGFGPIVTSNP